MRLHFRKSYLTLCLIVTNSLILFITLNLLWVGISRWRNRPDATGQLASPTSRPGAPESGPKRSSYQLAWVDTRAYKEVAPELREQILDDFFDFQSKGSLFVPYVQMAPPPFQSKTLNVYRTDDGFEYRFHPERGRGELTSEKLVYVFGGSTTFGWHVADAQTIPAQLELILRDSLPHHRIKVVNFGRPFYSWGQELTLLQRLLVAGHRPDLTLFIDGVNAGHEIPKGSDKLRLLWEQSQFGNLNTESMFLPPLVKLTLRWAKRKEAIRWENYLHERYSQNSPIPLAASYERTLKQIHAVVQALGGKTHFVLQPNRAYLCQKAQYATELPEGFIRQTEKLYRQMETFQFPNFTNLSHLCEQEQAGEALFVDDVHYGPSFSRHIAEAIAEPIQKVLESPSRNSLMQKGQVG